ERGAARRDVVAERVRAECGVVVDRDRIPVDPADEPVARERGACGQLDPVVSVVSVVSVDVGQCGHRVPTASTMICASWGAASSWKKWCAFATTVCGWPTAPGILVRNGRSPPAVTGSPSLKQQMNGLVHCSKTRHAARF